MNTPTGLVLVILAIAGAVYFADDVVKPTVKKVDHAVVHVVKKVFHK